MTSVRVGAASRVVTHLPRLRKGLGSLDWETAAGNQIVKRSERPAFRLLVSFRLSWAPWPSLPRRLGASRDSALTLVAAGEGAHLDLWVPSSSMGGAAPGAKGSPGAWKAQGAGQGAQHLGAGWEGAKSPSTTPSTPERAAAVSLVFATAPPRGAQPRAVLHAACLLETWNPG